MHTETILTPIEALAGARAIAHALADADGLTFDHARAAALLLAYLDAIEASPGRPGQLRGTHEHTL